MVSKKSTAFWFLAPAVFGMLMVHFIPILWGVYIGFLDLDIYTLTAWTKAPWVGLENYRQILSSGMDIGVRYLRAFWNVIFYGLITVPAGYVIGLAVALLMNQKFFGRNLVRGLILLPYITPDSVAYNVWRFIFQARIGLVNFYLIKLGLIDEPLIWLVGDRSIVAVIIATIWKGWPFASLILLAGLQSIPKELYEAARIDGASIWQQFLKITLPLLAPISGTLLLLSSIWNFHAFNQFFILLGRDPGTADVPSTLILREAFNNLHYGLGSAMAVVLTLVVLVLTIISLKVKRREEDALYE